MNKVATLCLLVFLAVFATACNDSVSLDQLSRIPANSWYTPSQPKATPST